MPRRLIFAAVLCLSRIATPGESAFRFTDVGEETGLRAIVLGAKAHSAGWGIVDASKYPSLFVGTFAEQGSKPAMLLRFDGKNFKLDEQAAGGAGVRINGRCNSALFADFDNDGSLDLFVASMPGNNRKDNREWSASRMFRNTGGGIFNDVSEKNGCCPPAFAARSAAVLDFDGDGLLDLLVGEDPMGVYSKTKSARLFRNKGNMQFEDVTKAAGIPDDVPADGVAVADVNNDGWPDIFLAARNGGNRLFLNDGKGHFVEAAGTREVFDWHLPGKGEDTPAGVCFCDVNRDGLMDLVIGQHFKRPWLNPVAVRLYLNRGVKNGSVVFEDVTERAGLVPLAMKAPHVELQDFDNDGWPDLLTSIVKFADGRAYPIIFRHDGVKDGLPHFSLDGWAVNDFPNAAEKSIQQTGAFFDAMIKDKKITYMAAAPTADFNRDGKLDIFMASWWMEAPSLLLRNDTPGGNWLDVAVEGTAGVNRMGIGAKVTLYKAGHLGEPEALLGCREIAAGYGYVSGQEAIAHFGLGAEQSCDVEVQLPHGKGKLERRGVKGGQRLEVK